MKILVKFFAIIREKTGVSQIEFQFDQKISVKDLKKYLLDQYPVVNDLLPNIITAVNHQFAYDEEEIPDHAEVAFFPPVSGGSGKSTIIRIKQSRISADELIKEMAQPSTGAVCTFFGIVREDVNQANNIKISYLEYEAYQDMAETKLQQIADEMRCRWPNIETIALVQRIGKIKPGAISTIVSCSAAHRSDGIFEGAQYGINRIKEIVPIWKKEISLNGEVWLEGNYHPGKGD